MSQNNDKYVILGMFSEIKQLLERVNNTQNKLLEILNENTFVELSSPRLPQPVERPVDNKTAINEALYNASKVEQKPTPLSKNVRDMEEYPFTLSKTKQFVPISNSNDLPNNRSIIEVESDTHNGKKYEIDYLKGTCSCPHYTYANVVCKHITRVIDEPNKYGLSNPLAKVLAFEAKKNTTRQK